MPVPSPAGFRITSSPASTTVPPEWVLASSSTRVPRPRFTTRVVPEWTVESTWVPDSTASTASAGASWNTGIWFRQSTVIVPAGVLTVSTRLTRLSGSDLITALPVAKSGSRTTWLTPLTVAVGTGVITDAA